MSLRTFFKLVEIQTKIASVFPFMVGILFVIYKFGTFKPINTVIFFCSMLIFDLTTTAINNYMDYRKATTETYRKKKNIIGQKEIPEKLVISLIFALLIIASSLGIILVIKTNIIVLFIGILCFAIGIFYTFGPLPISRLPLGEVFSGVTMGFGIIFLTVYVNAFDKGIIDIFWTGQLIELHANYYVLLEILWVSLPCVFTIANVMLANNICDLEEDISNHRYTLPYYIGRKKAIKLFDILYAATFLAIITAVIYNVLPIIILLSLFVMIPVYKHCRQFNGKQVKSETFVLSVKNLILVNGSIVTMFVISLLIL
ncbi:1,4-dihydroxy-2-naphthoate polyprenyltransferase [Bacillus niameyensis]|uniref:1,4-dihydroxy-2-naphthoate polyprenyltransferase n=1 Tax=Bacillus niameyensis TaxID=1522308 RepID=UPI0007849C6A|nr:1,4-dihydroxy-2-naphthoate polyprenyltransferase [Bacillus niameyensis]